MKRICRMLSCLLILALLPAVSAFADLQRGDQGEEVIRLQTMLFETGFLFELPDGDFGRNTEKAVKDYQKYAGMETTGIASDELIERLQEIWYELGYGEQTEGDALDGFTPNGMYPAFCNHWSSLEGNSQVDYCEKHMAIRVQAQNLMAAGDTESARKACELWREEIDRLYDIWIQCAGESCKASIASAQTLFWSSIGARESTLRSAYSARNVEPGELSDVEYAMETQLREHAAWLCELLSHLYGIYE